MYGGGTLGSNPLRLFACGIAGVSDKSEGRLRHGRCRSLLAESFATTTGLGFLIMDAWGVGDTLAMFNGILGMSVIGLLLYAAVWLSEVVLTPWCRAVQLH